MADVPHALRNADLHRLVDVTPDVALLQTLLVNVFLIGKPGSDDWVLIDAGLAGFAGRIHSVARGRFGDVPPRAIMLTHGHFDHVGSLQALLDTWGDGVPVYAHQLEMPYLTGRSAYPPADPTVGGGLVARSSPLYPRSPIDLEDRVHELPEDGTVPLLPGWRWIHTPGHTPGHVALFREDDGVLLPGDAFCTQKQESLLGVMTNSGGLQGPPAYFTSDWQAAATSVRRLAELDLTVAAPSHGLPIRGDRLRQGLQDLSARFEARSIPHDGRYGREPAGADETGVTHIPPPVSDLLPKIALAFALGIVVGITLANSRGSEE